MKYVLVPILGYASQFSLKNVITNLKQYIPVVFLKQAKLIRFKSQFKESENFFFFFFFAVGIEVGTCGHPEEEQTKQIKLIIK